VRDSQKAQVDCKHTDSAWEIMLRVDDSITEI